MTKLEALIGLNMVSDIGSIRLKKLLEYFGTPENILRAGSSKLTQVYGIGEKIAAGIHSLKKEDLDRELALAEKLGLKILIQEDALYPENLKNIYDPPIVLYVKGEIKPEDRLALGIVGSRRASYYGLSCAEKFAADLSSKGFAIVSGMARGIDTYAHRGALKAGGRTIAVMGSGFKHIYPSENKELLEKIAQNGAVITEFSLDTLPKKENFPRRNRVISGLSLGVLVVEAARNSGALITADCALEQGRDVFSLPGKVDSNTSFGTNGLIKQGAKLVSCVDDILEEFSIPMALATGSQTIVLQPITKSQKAQNKIEEVLQSNLSDEDENKIYQLLSNQSIQLDELVEKTNLDIPRISGILLRLQMKKLVRQLPGKQFAKVENEPR